MDILDAFTSFDRNSKMIENVINNTPDATVAVLALEGLYRMEGDANKESEECVASGQFSEHSKKIKELLRKWRCESPMNQSYSQAYRRVPSVLRNLTIFETLKVPLFIDDYGKKELLSSYGSRIEDIDIDGETPIYHVTHQEEAKKIMEEQRLKPSNNRNILEGCWFGQLDKDSSGRPSSVYGNRAFETTLSRLGIERLNQGEIVSYKKEVNVILYAADDGEAGLSGLKKPKLTDKGAYVKVSIFVPSRFLPNTDVDFHGVISEPIEIQHGTFCVKEKRSRGQVNCTREPEQEEGSSMAESSEVIQPDSDMDLTAAGQGFSAAESSEVIQVESEVDLTAAGQGLPHKSENEATIGKEVEDRLLFRAAEGKRPRRGPKN